MMGTKEEYLELMNLLEKRFGPRPTDLDDLRFWKGVRHGYVYGQIQQSIARLKELEARANLAQPSTEKDV